MTAPRVAFFTDSFLEVNGVAHTSRQFARYALEHDKPFFSVHTGPETRAWTQGSVETQELKSSPFVIRLEKDLALDVLFLRHNVRLFRKLRAFRPDLVHITGSGHMGMLGGLLALELNVPLVASWHTNVHEFAGRRFRRLLRFLPGAIGRMAANFLELLTLDATVWFYRSAGLLFAPNPELVRMLETTAKRPTYLMARGIDIDLFSPSRRMRADREFVIGFVGRLSAEKNVRGLVDLERELLSRGIQDYRFLVVGEGNERSWLAANLQRCSMLGVLLGQELAIAYANMDVFVFPSDTDTFGNVVLESLASGVPTLVSAGGGPKYIIRAGIDGFPAENVSAFADRIMELYHDPALRRTMSQSARAGASRYSWESVFDGVYDRYGEFLAEVRPGYVKGAAHAPALRHS